VGETEIPDDLRQFILTAFPSVPHLEALLLMRSDADRPWSAAAMAQSLYIEEKGAAAILRDLAAAELVSDDGDGPYRFRPRSADSAMLVDRLAALYARALVPVSKLIHERAAQLFADAFKLRKE
jgi:hypothetical protein